MFTHSLHGHCSGYLCATPPCQRYVEFTVVSILTIIPQLFSKVS